MASIIVVKVKLSTIYVQGVNLFDGKDLGDLCHQTVVHGFMTVNRVLVA